MKLKKFNIAKLVKNNTMLIKMMLSYLIICFISLITFATVLYNSLSQAGIEEVNRSSQQMLEQGYNTADILLTSTYRYFLNEYTQNVIINNALTTSTFGGRDYFEVGKELNNFALVNPLIYSVYLYNKQKNAVFSNLDVMKSVEDFYDKDILEILSQNNDEKEIFIPRRVEYKINDKNYSMNLITIIFKFSNISSLNYNAMVININQSTLQRMINKGSESDYSSSFIINSQGKIVSDTYDLKSDNDLKNKEYISKIISSKEKSGYFIDTISEKKYLISYVKSSGLGWYFVNRYEYNQLFKSVKYLQSFILIITIIFLLIGILLSTFSIRNIYSPINKIINDIRKKVKETQEIDDVNEYEFLKGSFNQMIGNVSKLKDYLHKNSNARRKELLRMAIFGGILRLDEFKKEVQDAGINFNFRFFIVVVFTFDSFNKLKKEYSSEDLSLYRFALANIAIELFGLQYYPEAYIDELDHVSIILVSDDDYRMTAGELEPIICQVQENVMKYFGFSLSAAIGSVVEGIRNIKDSYTEALNASKYRLVFGRNSIIDSRNIPELVRKEHVYPEKIDNQIVNLLRLGNIEKIKPQIEEFLNSIKSGRYDGILLSVTQLAWVIVNTGRELNMNYQFIYNKLITLDSMEEIYEWLINICETIIDIKTSNVDNKKDEVIQKIVTYIDEHYQDPNFSVEEVAQFIDLSPNYIRTIFKNNINQSLSDYISELRFKKAKALLEETGYTSKEISKMVGFLNDKYFYTSFKKNYGISPEEYRRSSPDKGNRQ